MRMRPHTHYYRFPWRAGNRFRLLVDGDNFFPPMLKAIREARRHVLLEMYLFESGDVSDSFIDALTQAAQRGVTVCLLLDAYGAGGLNKRDRLRLHEAGAFITDYNPLRYGRWRRNLFRDHRKLLLIDGKVGFVGGAGITDDFAPESRGDRYWHDAMVQIEGPCAADWQVTFSQIWNSWAGPPLALPPAYPAPPEGGELGRVVGNAPWGMEIKRSLVKRVRNAECRVWLATAYFIPSRKIRRALRVAARNGADVRLLLPGPISDHPAVRHAGRRYYARLLRNGVRIFEYQPRFLHTKVMLCDGWASIGSSNIDRWNQRWNLDANQEVDAPSFAAQVQAMFEADFAASQEYHYDQWDRRPWHRRLLEWFWGKVDLWLTGGGEPPRDQGP